MEKLILVCVILSVPIFYAIRHLMQKRDLCIESLDARAFLKSICRHMEDHEWIETVGYLEWLVEVRLKELKDRDNQTMYCEARQVNDERIESIHKLLWNIQKEIKSLGHIFDPEETRKEIHYLYFSHQP